MIFVYNDDKTRADFEAMIEQLQASCWGWLD